jgi:hypothetical protein
LDERDDLVAEFTEIESDKKNDCPELVEALTVWRTTFILFPA